MRRPITKTIRLSGQASTIEDAVSTILGRAALTIDSISSFRIVEISGDVSESGAPSGFRVMLDIVFTVRDDDVSE